MPKELLNINISYCYVTEAFQEKYFERCLSVMPEVRQRKIRRFRLWKDAQASLLGCCMIAHDILGGDFSKLSLVQHNSYGKPFIEGYPYFNLTHAGEIVALASWGNEVGIDIEVIKEIDLRDFETEMTTMEWKRIKQSADINSFYKLWTQKEAVVKALGKGLSVPLKEFEINDEQTVLEQRVYYIKEVLLDENYICNIASPVDMQQALLAIKLKNPFDYYQAAKSSDKIGF